MRPLQPAPEVPGNTDWERFDNAVMMLLSAPKQAFVKAEEKQKKAREKEAGRVEAVGAPTLNTSETCVAHSEHHDKTHEGDRRPKRRDYVSDVGLTH